MLTRIFAFSLLISFSAFAADDCDPAVIAPGVISSLVSVSEKLKTQCPNEINVANFCSAIEAQTLEMEPTHPSVMYRYQNLVFAASCVLTSDSETIVKAKVQNFWNRYHNVLNCNHFNFNPKNGSVLKLAVARQAEPFIEDALSSWKVGLNHVDQADQLTVLDYIENRKKDAGASSSFSKTLQRYYERFRAAGAKHKREL
jgi:hypothetical protein